MNIPITVLDELKEVSLGSLEGQYKGDGELLEYWKMGGTIEGAELYVDFVSRVALALNKALESNADDKPILIVAHSVVYRAIREILQLQSDEDGIRNCYPVFHKPPIGQDAWSVHTLELK
jgi:broad specificity phosphatase PhoE